MSGQTSIYASGQPIGFAGLVVRADVSVPRLNGEASLSLPMGYGVKPGTLDNECKRLSASNSNVEGVIEWDAAHMPGTIGDLETTSPYGLKPKAQFNLLRKGLIWLPIAVGISSITPYTDRGYVLFQTDGGDNTVPGIWSNAQDGGTDFIDVTRLVQFVSGIRTGSDGLKIALAEVDFTRRNS